MSSTPRCNRRTTTVALVAAVVASVLATVWVVAPASAQAESAREQRAQVRAEQARVAAQVDALKGDQQQVAAALGTLDENVRGRQAALTDARRQVELSTAEAREAERAIASTSAQVDELQARVVAYAVDAYVSPPEEDVLRRLEASSAQEDATRRALLQMRSGTDADVLDELRAARQRLDDQRQRAVDARRSAEQAAAEAEQALHSLDQARTEQQAFAEQVRARLDDRLADAAHLARVDADLGQRVAEEEAALAAAVARVPVARGGPSTGAAGGSSRLEVASVKNAPRPPLVTVGGITVAASVGPNLRQLLAAAAADGIHLDGYGWRDSRNQVALRGQNCGWSDYQLYEMPADQCSPPTARPGASLHEQGLAVDFSVGGAFIESRSSPAFRWLAANAARFGFANLPSEPWHWSTTGA